ncbi:MAG: T9SS type A sorting domain-containing protein [Flavobacteriales bacterium]|nr:T9SS type A sorting domain-containing protein [Flavobacteriales bacterium]
MRRPLLLACALLGGMAVSAQTLLFDDNFDNLSAGMGVAEQNSGWDTWDGSAGVDGEVSSDFASSGSNSAKIDGTGVDLVLPIGPYNGSGKYDVKFKMYIPIGSGGAYFNAMHQWSSSSTSYQWAVDVFFNNQGNVTWTAGFVEGGDAQVTLGQWFDIQITADQDADLGYLYLNGEMIHSWTWSLNNANGMAGLNQIAAVDFYGTNTSQGEGLYYIDDVELWESTGVYVQAVNGPSEPAFFPNPANDNLTVSLPETWNGATIQVIDLTGKVAIERRNVSVVNTHFDLSSLAGGVYLVKMKLESNELTRKLIIRN